MSSDNDNNNTDSVLDIVQENQQNNRQELQPLLLDEGYSSESDNDSEEDEDEEEEKKPLPEETNLIKENKKELAAVSASKLSTLDKIVCWLDAVEDVFISGTFDQDSSRKLFSTFELIEEHHKKLSMGYKEWEFLMLRVALILSFSKTFCEVSATVLYVSYMYLYDDLRVVFSVGTYFPLFATGINWAINWIVLEDSFRWTIQFSKRVRLVSLISNVFHAIYLFLVVFLGWFITSWIALVLMTAYSILTCFIPAYWVAYEMATQNTHFTVIQNNSENILPKELNITDTSTPGEILNNNNKISDAITSIDQLMIENDVK